MHTAYARAIIRLKMTLSNSLPFKYTHTHEIRTIKCCWKLNKPILRNNRVNCANGLNIFSLPSFLSGNVMLDLFPTFWYGLVMFAVQPKIYSAASTVRLIANDKTINWNCVNFLSTAFTIIEFNFRQTTVPSASMRAGTTAVMVFGIWSPFDSK